MIDIKSAAAALCGDVSGRDSITCPGPGHSLKDRSLSVKLTADGPVVFSHAGDDWRACKDHVNRALGIEQRKHVAHVSHLTQVSISGHPGASCDAPSSDLALRIWRESKPIAGSLAERYLQSRKLGSDHSEPDALRFHPSCPFGSDKLPCMVALYRDISTNEPKAIHRTALTPEGQKIDRKALGPKSGCAIKFTPDEHVEQGLTIAEGVETALAGMQLHWRPAWALGDATEIKKFPVLSGIECLNILVDNDAAGRGAALECSTRWTAAGRHVFRIIPVEERADIADVAFGRAA